MAIASAFLVPGSPLPYVQPENPPWGHLAQAMKSAGESLSTAGPDTILVYSTQWIAVLDQLWQTRPHLEGVHVDENWHEFGELPFSIDIDVELAERAVEAATDAGIKSKGVNYDHFPIDTGTIVAANFLNPGNRIPLLITSNNVYHDWQRTEEIGSIAAAQADELNRNAAVVVVGGLSGTCYRQYIDPGEDRIATESDDAWNRKILRLMEQGDVAGLRDAAPDFAEEAKADMGFKHLAFLLGAVGGNLGEATVHGYGPLYGTGGAVVEFDLS